MRIPTFIRAALIATLGFAAVGVSGRAHAEEEFDVAVEKGHVVVHAKGSWHINKEYPWRLVVGEKKIGKERFEFSEKSASIEAPKGEQVIVRGGVCNGDQCMRLEKSIKIP
jgi:hypothetical protein